MTAANGFLIPGPMQLAAWLEKNAASLQPPVNNKCLYSGDDFILMAVGGPNSRKDYHSKLFGALIYAEATIVLTRLNLYSQPNRGTLDIRRVEIIR